MPTWDPTQGDSARLPGLKPVYHRKSGQSCGLEASKAAGLVYNDLVRITPSGLHPGPGALARRYVEIGGSVHRYGKPLTGRPS
jgi:hypothetical protein